MYQSTASQADFTRLQVGGLWYLLIKLKTPECCVAVLSAEDTQSINQREICKAPYTTRPGAPAVVSGKHDHKVHCWVVFWMYRCQYVAEVGRKSVPCGWATVGDKKVKVFPYSLPSVGLGADPGVQAVSPQVTWSESRHIPSSRLPLLSARPAVTSVAFTRWRYL